MRTERNRAARSNYEQLRLSVTRGRGGKRTVVVWFKEKHQDWKYAHVIWRAEYDELEGLSGIAQCFSAAQSALEEAEDEVERGGSPRY